MGKWAEVHCSCPNRRPLPDSGFPWGEPPRGYKGTLEEWEQTKKHMFECGHRNGVVIEFWPGEFIYLGYLIGRIFPGEFEIFQRAGDWRCYDDELLLIEPADAELWLMEIDELERALNGFGNLPYQKMNKLILEFFRSELGREHDLKERLDQIAAEMPFAPINSIKENLERDGFPDLGSTMEKIRGALTDAAQFCRAGIETGNPVRLLW